MRVNEKIQYYRKRAGLSQEELGQRLMVSRQTVSLWETGQTLPTLDNLVRLREIFGVSIDELLSEDASECASAEGELDLDGLFYKEADAQPVTDEQSEALPLERYEFKYSELDVKRIEKSSETPGFVFMGICLVFVIGIIISAISSMTMGFWEGFALGVMLLGFAVFGASSINLVRTNRKNRADRMAAEHLLLVYADRFVYKTFLDGELHTQYTVDFDEIRAINQTKDFNLVTAHNLVFYFKRADMSETSALLSAKPKKKEMSDGARGSSVVLLVLNMLISVAAPFAIAIASVLVTDADIALIILATALGVIPVLSVAFSVWQRIKGCRELKAMISGLIAVFVIAVSVTVSWDLGNYYPLENAESYMEIELPDSELVTVNKIEDYIEDDYVFYYSEIYYTDDQVSEFEKSIENDRDWLTYEQAQALISTCPDGDFFDGADRVIFYEFFYGERNYVGEDGEFLSYIAIGYWTDENMMRITEYDINNQYIE